MFTHAGNPRILLQHEAFGPQLASFSAGGEPWDDTQIQRGQLTFRTSQQAHLTTTQKDATTTGSPRGTGTVQAHPMDTWDYLMSHLRSLYRPAEDTGGLLKIFCKRPDDEFQLMIVERAAYPDCPDEEWATILSPVGTAHCVDADALLQQAGWVHVVGGVVRIGDVLYLRHSIPLSTMSLNDFMAPFQSILTAATKLERHFMP